jgi:hypothetical protein
MDLFLKILAKKERWEPPDIKGLVGFPGLKELRWRSGNVQHRLIGHYHGTQTFLLLLGCTHKQRRYDPAAALDTAKRRQRAVENGEARTCEYPLFVDK